MYFWDLYIQNHVITIKMCIVFLRYGHINEVWDLLKNVLPEWKLPLQEWEKALIEEENKKKEETQSPVS